MVFIVAVLLERGFRFLYEGGWALHPAGAPTGRLTLLNLTDSVAFKYPEGNQEPKLSWFQGLFYFKAKVKINTSDTWVLINRRSAQKWLAKRGVHTTFNVAKSFFGHVSTLGKSFEGVSEEQKTFITPEVERYIEEHPEEKVSEIVDSLKSVFETPEKLKRTLAKRQDRNWALKLLVSWGRYVRQTSEEVRQQRIESTERFIETSEGSRIYEDFSPEELIRCFRVDEMLSRIIGFSKLTFDEGFDLFEFIDAKRGELEFPEGKDFQLFGPAKTGLARSVLFFRDRSCVIQLNRKNMEDKRIGGGNYSSVKLGWDVTRETRVAISTIHSGRDPDYLDTKTGYGVAKEIGDAKGVIPLGHQLEHESRQGGTKFKVITPYIPGGSITQPLRSGTIPQERARAHAVEILEGLENIHARGVIHGDIKSDNIVVDEKGHIYIIDFGLAHKVERSDFIGGSPPYMAPEELRGMGREANIAKQHDVFSAGCVLWDLLSKDVTGYFKWETNFQRFDAMWNRALQGRVFRGVWEAFQVLRGSIAGQMRGHAWMLAQGKTLASLKQEAAQEGNFAAQKALLIAQMLGPMIRRPTVRVAHGRLAAILEAEKAAAAV